MSFSTNMWFFNMFKEFMDNKVGISEICPRQRIETLVSRMKSKLGNMLIGFVDYKASPKWPALS